MAQKLSKRKTRKILVSKKEHIKLVCKTNDTKMKSSFKHKGKLDFIYLDSCCENNKAFKVKLPTDMSKKMIGMNYCKIPDTNNFLMRVCCPTDWQKYPSYNFIISNNKVVGSLLNPKKLTNGKYLNYEDVRLAKDSKGKIIYTATKCDNKVNPPNIHISIGEMDGKKYFEGVYKSKVEKNWSMFEGSDLVFVYSYSPFTVIKINENGTIKEIFRKEIKELNGYRGSTPFKRYKDGYIGIIHTVLPGHDYFHRFIRLNDKFEITYISKIFKFDSVDKSSVEFCLDFEIIGDNNFIIYYQTYDRRPKIIKFNFDKLSKKISKTNRIYYWRPSNFVNAGDYFNKYMLGKIYPANFEYCDNDKVMKDIFAGSILTHKAINNSNCYGAGYSGDTIQNNIKYKIIRGYLTRNKLKEKGIDTSSLVYGDPGLLASYLFKSKVDKKYKYGIIPHYLEFEKYKKIELPKGVRLIDIRTDDIEKLMDEINECEYILSSSLHGIIFSHSYGIKAIRIKMENDKTQKFDDYYSIYERKSDTDISLKTFDFSDIESYQNRNYWAPDKNFIINKQLELLKNFPIYSLK